jgi:hypothetical protein
LQTGSLIKLEWTFSGIGKTACTHDGVPVPTCKSPLTLKANAIATEDTKHNFTVTFTDVCGRVKTASFSYTQKGVVPETKVDPPVDKTVPVTLSTGTGVAQDAAAGAGGNGTKSGNAGAFSQPSGYLAVATGLAAVLLAAIW